MELRWRPEISLRDGIKVVYTQHFEANSQEITSDRPSSKMSYSISTIDPSCCTTRLVSTIESEIEEQPEAQLKTQFFVAVLLRRNYFYSGIMLNN